MSNGEEKKKKKLPPGVRERDGRYTYRYSVDVIVDGKRTRKQKETPSFASAKEAYDAGILLEADRLQGRLIDEKNITLGQWKTRWLKDYEVEREPRPTTLRNRKTALSSLEKHLGEHTRLKDINGDDFQQYLNQLKKDGYGKGTLQQYHTCAKMVFSDAVRKEIIVNNPAKGAKIPVYKQSLEEIESGISDVPKFLEKKQLKHFLNIVRFRGLPQEYEIFLILAYTGLRIGELLALKASDFDEKGRTLSITKTLTVIAGVKKYSLGPPKNKPSIRKVSIGDTVIKAIKAQFAWRKKRTINGELLHDADFIFWSNKQPGYPVSASYLDFRFNRLLKIAELPGSLTPHSLRHTHVSLLAEAGEELVVIQERLGHKNDEITRLVYLHVTEGQRKAVPDRFERVMRS